MELLRRLPRDRDRVPDARREVGAFGAAHPGLHPMLAVDRPPASPTVDYDLLLRHPDGGTVALAWRGDAGVPWAIEYSDHWAANYVVSVDGQHVSVQQALLTMRFTGWRSDDLMTDLVDWAIIHHELEASPRDTPEPELQAAADTFRAAHGLFTAEATEAWLRSLGLDLTQFSRMIAGAVETRRLAVRVTGGDTAIDAFYAADPSRADRVGYLELRGPGPGGGRGLWARALERLQRGEPVQGTIRQRYAFELPPVLATAAPGQVAGGGAGPDTWVAEVLSRVPAPLDGPTRRAIQDHLFRQWLARRREEATIRWHWVEPPIATLAE